MDSTTILYIISCVALLVIGFLLGFEAAKKIIADKLEKSGSDTLIKAYKLGYIAAIRDMAKASQGDEEVQARLDKIMESPLTSLNEEPR